MRAQMVLFSLLAVAAARGECGRSPAYDACAGKPCGDACTVCPPGATDCVETAVVKACDPQGRCVPDTGDLCGTIGACTDRSCGDPCVIDPPCRAATPPCMVPLVEGRCDASGTCLALGLPVPLCPPHPDCVGKACGDSCNPCGPDERCPTLIASACDRFGDCAGDVPWLCHDPCAGKACGEGCSLCPPPPEGEGCFETADLKACDAVGRCVSAPAACAP
jgi:hypothetical protein